MHTAVLPDKVLEYLAPKANENFIDCTAGDGGHTRAILEKNGPKGRVLAIDQDAQALERAKTLIPRLRQGFGGQAKSKYQNRLMLVQDNFANLQAIVQREKFRPVHGILFDLGMSSSQLEESGRGFSFQKREPLDMRYSQQNPTSAEKIVNFWSKKDLAGILKEYGEEQFADKIAEAIVRKRSEKHIDSTNQLVDIVLEATPGWYRKKKIHPATKTFQALRIAVNRELENLQEALPQSLELLENQGTLVVISFHSLEDRMVKNFFKDNPRLSVLTKKPVGAARQEVQKNPRSRSARMRAARKTTNA